MLATVLFSVACAGSAGHDTTLAPVPPVGPGQEEAVFAGGCFWCLESDFDKLKGVVNTTSGYAGGRDANPTYDEVGAGATGHTEVVRVVYDPKVVTFEGVLDWFWHHVDPTDAGGQFCDRGSQYRSGIYPVNDAQLKAAEASKRQIDASGVLPSKIVTEIVAGQTFHPAEVYHQDFHVTTPSRYLPYRMGCGRDARVAEVWKKAH